MFPEFYLDQKNTFFREYAGLIPQPKSISDNELVIQPFFPNLASLKSLGAHHTFSPYVYM